MRIRDELKNLVGKKTTVKIKGDDGYYYNDMVNSTFTEDDARYYEEFLQDAYLYGIDYCHFNNVYIVEIHE